MNWGNKLLVTFIVFGAGMLFLVFRSMRTNYELVEKDYYKKELRYQEVIEGSESANALNSQVKFEQTANGILLQLPDEMKNKNVAGNILFYCAYDAAKDRKFDLQTNTAGQQLFPLQKIEAGNYTVKINWNEAGKKYYAEKNVTVF